MAVTSESPHAQCEHVLVRSRLFTNKCEKCDNRKWPWSKARGCIKCMKVWHQHCQPVSEVVHPLVEVAHQVVVEVVTPAERTLHHPRTYPTTVGGTRPTVAVKAVDPSRETSSRVVPSRPWPLPVHRVGAQGFRSVQAAALAVLSRSRTVLLEPAELQLEDAVPAKGATVSAPSVPGVFSDRPVGK